ncbi:autotransporter domain-containing protein [Pseudomonas sp. zbq_18]|uniref:autotransporter outer membrane beta-barrel domain-containing protein n=1 Tax=Pseudomonadota TaxID=1224 RepID=UPI00370A52B7
MADQIFKRLLLSLALCPIPQVWANCSEYFVGDNLYYIGRTNSQSIWVANTQATGNYALSAPGVPNIDTWASTKNPEYHLSLSPVVADDLNGNHQLQILGVSGDPIRPNCLVATRSQVNPIIPPTWRPPQKPVLPAKPERPTLPELPEVSRPEIPNRPVVSRPTLPDLPVVSRPEIPNRPVVGRPTLPELPQVPDRGRPLESSFTELPNLAGEQHLSNQQIDSLCRYVERDESGQFTAETLQRCPALAQALKQAPLTPGRDLIADTLWNVWVDPHYVRTNNRRGYGETEQRTTSVTLGADRRLNSDLAVGALLSISDLDSDSLDGLIKVDGNSYNLGPYVSYQLSNNWSAFANITVGKAEIDHKVLMFKGSGDSTTYGATANIYGDFAWSERTSIRPKLGINYQKEDIEDFDLRGRVFNRYLNPRVNGINQESGQVLASIELNSMLELSSGHLFVPYFEVGSYYNYLQEDTSTYPEWQGLIRTGLRTLYKTNTQIDLNLSYESLGVSGLDIWDFGLYTLTDSSPNYPKSRKPQESELPSAIAQGS